MIRARHALAAAALSVGCAGSAEPGHYPGASSAAPEVEPPRPRAPPVRRQRWERYDEVLSWPPARTAFSSLGHFSASQTATVHVDAAAREAYLALVSGSRLEAGSIVAQLHSDARTRRRGPLFAMHKLTAERWEYLVVDAAGLIEERGDLPLCSRCHADGLADHLFGPPRRIE